MAVVTSTGRFVGRAHELALMAEMWTAAASGRRQVVVVSGDAGIGKTRFCDQAAQQAANAGFRVVFGRCWPDGGAPCLWPWHAVLNDLLGPAGSRLLAGDTGDRIEGDEVVVEPERFNRFLAVADRLTEACLHTPTMIVIDDVQHADAGAVLLIRFLARSLDRVPLVIVLTRRFETGGAARGGTAAARLLTEIERDATAIALHRFDVAETASYLRIHGRQDLDSEIVDTIVSVTGGVPLFLARIVAQDSEFTGAAGVEAAIAESLARLPAWPRRVVAIGAVLGNTPAIEDVARMTVSTPGDVLDAVRPAVAAGLVEVDPNAPDTFTFVHEIVRQAARSEMSPSEELDAHARAAALLAGDARPDRLVRHAHHALAASLRSDADAALAVTACRAAAAVMEQGFDYERAAELLGAAAERAEQVAAVNERAAVLVEWAEALLACGRFGDASDVFERAVAACDAAGDPVLRARAALAAGGFWLNQTRHEIDRQRAVGRQRRALDGLASEETALRVRLAVRLAAAAAVYDGAPVEPVLMALAEARRSGDPAVLAEALSFAHHALLPPDHASTRLPLADELIEVASAAGDALHALLGLMWRTIDLYQLGSSAATRSLAELRERADALACRSVLYIVSTMDVMRLIRSGRLDEAEAAAGSCFEMGIEVGDADALGYYGAHLLTIRWLQGRDEELDRMVEEVAASPTLVPREFSFRAMTAAIAARAGRPDRARAVLDGLATEGLAALPQSSTWLSGMVCVVEAASALGDKEICREAYGQLAPFAALPVLPSFAVTCLGSVERSLGRAAITFEDAVTAVAHLERAVAANRLFGNRPFTVLSRAELGAALAARGHAGDAARAAELLARAAGEADEIGMTVRARRWRDQAEPLRRSPSATAGPGRDGGIELRAEGKRWLVAAVGRRAFVPDLVGMRYLRTLMDHPGRDIPALDLCGADVVDPIPHAVLDEAAVRAYRSRAAELDSEVAQAEADADLARAERLRIERDALTDEVTRALGLGGRARRFPTATERARTSVRKAIKRSIETVTLVDPEIGAVLAESVSTGTTCRFDPGETPQ